MRDLVQFHWPVDESGYEVFERAEQAIVPDIRPRRAPTILDSVTEPGGLYIRPKGGTVRTQPLFVSDPVLFMEFAATPRTPEGVIGFANKYGLLFSGSAAKEDGTTPAELLDGEWYGQMEGMAYLVEKANKKEWSALPERVFGVTSVLAPPSSTAPGELPTLKVRPNTLMSAIMLQFALHVSSPIGELKMCAQCKKWFPFGSGTGKRSTAMYCSKKCNERAKYERRNKKTGRAN